MTDNTDLDRIDRSLLDALQRDARAPLRDLATRTSAAASTCSERIRRMVARGVITGFHAGVDLAHLGRPVEAMVFAQVRPLSRTVIETFHAEALQMPEVMSVFVLAGGDDFLLHIGVPDVAAVHAFVVDQLSSRREVVQFRSSIIFAHGRRQVLESLLPEGQRRGSRERLRHG